MPGARIARLHPWANAPFRPAPSITSQPSNQSAAVGSTATFSVTASDALSYQWQKYNQKTPTFKAETHGSDSSFANSTITATAPTVAVGDLEILWCAAGALSPTAAPTFSTPAGWNSAGDGGSVAVVGGAVNTRVHLFWRISPDTGSSVVLNAGTTAAMVYGRLSYSNPLPDGAYVQASFGSDAGGDTSIVVSSLTASANSLLTTFITQGVAQGITPPGGTSERIEDTVAGFAVFDEAASGGATGTRTYTLPSSSDGAWGFAEFLPASPWDAISGATSSSYTTPTLVLGDDGSQYRCIVTGYGGQTPTNTVTLTVTASSGYSLTVTPGSYSVTGSSASLVASRALSVTPASYAVTGSSANLARGFALSVTPASYSMSGSSASLVASRALSVTPGSYSVVGSDVDLTYTPATTAYELLVTPGSYGLTGSTASLTAERNLQTTPGAYSVTGANAGLTAGRVLTVTPASYAVSAQSASLVASRSLSVTPGAYALTGSPVELDYASTVKELIVLPGSYSLTGADVELEYQPVVQSSGHGFVMVDFEPRIWWMRKPKALDEEEAAEKVKEVAKKIERIVVRKIEQGKAIKTPELKAQVKEAIAPQVAQMPGFDWKALYAAILVRLMEQQAQELAQMELERIRLFEQDEEDALILLMA